ncbi:hypothetical protein BC938DRAFT_479885 [Jimgerdemannia flammicorona]|uniref:Uncharacterized protein n=1 Tax=Jimgerdemannia flammicorona TaxID=994334 RepID=A0A433QJW8_9FUNG|nr:hypothetical protein BC938DRAFT_479885 [Jimgerdemannia flammicorona]
MPRITSHRRRVRLVRRPGGILRQFQHLRECVCLRRVPGRVSRTRFQRLFHNGYLLYWDHSLVRHVWSTTFLTGVDSAVGYRGVMLIGTVVMPAGLFLASFSTRLGKLRTPVIRHHCFQIHNQSRKRPLLSLFPSEAMALICHARSHIRMWLRSSLSTKLVRRLAMVHQTSRSGQRHRHQWIRSVLKYLLLHSALVHLFSPTL